MRTISVLLVLIASVAGLAAEPAEADPLPALVDHDTLAPPQGAPDATSETNAEHGDATPAVRQRVTRKTPPRSEPEPTPPPDHAPPPERVAPRWYERLAIRGYTQLRYNRLPSAVRNDDLINLQGDRSIGGGNGFFVRRARLILYGDLHEHLSIYFQPDFASTTAGQMHTLILRDWYADIFFDKKHRFRLRAGQSKVPYGFENLQSSQNRLALDRNDALNSAVKDERDLGLFFYWTPVKIQQRFRHLVQSGLKGSGDYGVVGFGVYNGQTANTPMRTDNLHVIGRVSYPLKLGKQFVELGGGGYYGRYHVPISEGGGFRAQGNDPSLLDARVHGTLVIYPQPLGFQAEATWGVGPQQGRAGREDPGLIRSRPLYGAYAQLMYKVDGLLGTDAFIPFVRGTWYDGGKKFVTNAPHYQVKELELGLEWQIFRNLEVVLAYDIVERTSDLPPHNLEYGHVTRIQVQVNLP